MIKQLCLDFLAGFAAGSFLYQLFKLAFIRNPYKSKQTFFSTDELSKISNARVTIFGIGGVGSHTLLSLALSGVKNITIIDFDQVTISSLNRHAFATREHVGKSKVQVFQDYLQQISPKTKLTIHEAFVRPDNVKDFFQNEKPDLVIDCIDNIDAKTALVAYCFMERIPILSSCGAGMKSDPTRIRFGDLSEISNDDLARALRKNLKKLGIRKGITVIYSQEVTERKLLPLKDHQINQVDQFRPFQYYRIRIVPVLGTMPALIGLGLANFGLCQLAGKKIKFHEISEISMNHYSRFHTMLIGRAKKIGKTLEDLNLDMEEIYILVRDVYEWKCLLKDKKTTQIEMIQWDPEGELNVFNLVLMYGNHAKFHYTLKTKEEILNYYPKEIHEKKIQKDQLLKEILSRKERIYK